MKNPLAIFKPKINQGLKNRVLKNREAILDIMSQNIQGARQCPFLLGQKCLGQMCELFMEFKSVSAENKEIKFWRCSFVETPLLIIELNQNIRKLIELSTREKDK